MKGEGDVESLASVLTGKNDTYFQHALQVVICKTWLLIVFHHVV